MCEAWGGGEVASADGIRFVVPIRTIHAGPNPRYFGRERGVTYYNMTSDQYTGINGVVVPGTLRDSLVLLSVLLEQETELKPVEIMTDTGAYTDAIFGIFYLLVSSSAQGSLTRAVPAFGGSIPRPITAHSIDWRLIA